ncbi:AAA family ATPase [Acutalibacter intestini]|uniref:AAA family ATPase n=1 Tax=Acutalibacter intestini TaxID=3093659 RepID=UPI002AC8D0DB|nr:MoxR family ATPase [Acutalibacter sp. M00204]
MTQPKALGIINEVRKAIVGKDTVVCKVLMAILAGGHVLLEDNPGVGKTTLALAFSRAMSMSFTRMQFTPETMPADVVGYTMYNQEFGRMEYRPGAVMNNLFLADEINRTSAKTQSALLEVMEEGQVTVDGVSYRLSTPFAVIATQNPLGTAGTQPLPESQLDRFMLRLSIGYPAEDQEVKILKQTEGVRPLEGVLPAATLEEVERMIAEAATVYMADDLYRYVAALCAATREDPALRLGASPRAGAALVRACRASAWMGGRDYVVPADINLLFYDVMGHRVVLEPQAKMSGQSARSVLEKVVGQVPAPKLI